MRINAYQWQLYLRSGGQEAIERFASGLHGDGKQMQGLVISLFKAYCPDTFLAQAIEESIAAFAEAHANAEDAFAERGAPGAYTYEEEAAALWEEIAAEYAGTCQERATDRKIFELFANDIVYISMMLTAQAPDAFIPYFSHVAIMC